MNTLSQNYFGKISKKINIGFYGLGPSSFPYVNYQLAELGKKNLALIFPPTSLLRLGRIANACKKTDSSLTIFGYSRGAISAINLCKMLTKQKKVDFLYLIDPIAYFTNRLRIPENVIQGFICYQRNGARTPFLFGRFGKGIADYVFCGQKTKNFMIEQAFKIEPSRVVMHEDMVEYCLFRAKITLLSLLNEE
ncbi:alpha/beta hydrolase [Candidatus Methylacidiphilum fumarolicum]|uniref:Alpha/beta hydrolase superfamily protein n=3 Tax=Candidatus Methylacidiphilum fumarolicum TaxID=591154 RepID=I0JWK4_METFB|nr:alpha/beta hydrolase [Candidatus Methylacidiphilum fumarolicum]TFE68656.1 alpha/beta hydrolase [Candidatus Methylacidiphilum fumarolicum]TFE77522.1 alpha/beta hydrolase [Candidatus Methylacidiphilum fumarolicum]CAI9085584.1 Alpha/beta hydrolase superfamily protein [Candidatus Methylacidiphilum fumarolicum]CCG91623.1 Alpha/beta hydrolase superfamily protein [Methylacidiphilum fumariolicum SolV]